MLTKSSITNVSTISSAWVSKLVLTALSLYSIRIIGINLNAELCAIYFVGISLLGWFNLSDFGIGASVQNYISECRAANKSYKNYQTALNQIVIFISLLTIIIIFSISNIVVDLSFDEFKNVDINYKENIFICIALLICITNIFGIINKILYAVELGFIANIGSMLGALFSLLLIFQIDNLTINKLDLNNYIIIIYGPTLIVTTILFLIFNKFQVHELYKIEKKIIGEIIFRAKNFFLIGIYQAFIINLDFIIAANYLKPIDIITYGVLTRIFGFTAFFYTSVYALLWPKFTKYLTLNDWKKLKYLLISSIAFSITLITIFTVFFQIHKTSIINYLYSNQKVEIDFSLIVLMGFYHVIISLVHSFGIILQSISNLKSLLKWMPIQALLSISLQIYLVPKYGIYGITISLLLSFLFTLFWVLPLDIYKLRYSNAS